MGDPTDQSTDVEFTACGADGYPCSGEVDGAPYDLRLPETWNGTLLIYSHGLRPADPLTKDGPAFEPIAEPAPGVAAGIDVVADALLEQGYALAGAGSPTGGWTIADSVASLASVRAAFVTHIGVPNRIYTWGQSLGGLAALQSGQANDWVSGSASMCGLLGGLNPNLDLALDAAVAVKALLAPKLKLTGFESIAEAQSEYRRATKAVSQAGADTSGSGMVALQVIAAVAEIPTRNRTSDGTTPQSLSAALVENISRVLARSTIERFRIEEQYGGNPSTNVGVNYGARVMADEAEEIDRTAGQSATLGLVRQIADLPAVEADPSARTAAGADFPNPSALTKPIVTMHTAVDPMAVLANETLYGSWAAQSSGQDIRWLNINVATPPTIYPDGGPAPYGAGHCAFTAPSIVGGVQILDDWVRLGRFPSWAGNAIAFGPDSGFSGPTALPTWPQSPTTVTG